LLTIGCASGASGAMGADGGSATASARIEPPRLLRGNPPELRLPPGSVNRPDPLRITIEVLVAANGEPDMRTLRVTGRGASENREAIASWIRSAAFQPARQAGEPVAAVYRTSIGARVVR